MAVSVFELFKIGIGPSSSHTVGPMRAARTFVRQLDSQDRLGAVARVKVTLYGSLAHTGRGHGTDKAVILGLLGDAPDTIDPDTIEGKLAAVRESGRLTLPDGPQLKFREKQDLVFNKRESLPYHPNGMRFMAFDGEGTRIAERDYYSVGGGFVVNHDAAAADRIVRDDRPLPYPFETARELRERCNDSGLSISQVMMANEQAWRSREEVREGLLTIHRAMQSCIERGCHSPGVLPGGLKVKRRAPTLYTALKKRVPTPGEASLGALDWVNLYALAVNEENAAGGRVVTAPTNGAAGIIPAVLGYYLKFVDGADEDGVVEFLLTAGAIGILYMLNASISGAEVGCQGEVGVACSMAAGGLTAAMGGTPAQVENAAEIGMEHNLGLTCDPVGGLVQVPCIERNAMGAVKAINAQRLALRGDGGHIVSLDKVIKTMADTGKDMKRQYKETSRGGLAVNVIEC
ncbi:MAG: L-serine ammonia-lyase [Xanthomonadales bacterium]|jgi:L-serine dehydratase|nr:L-serine ammonia-lyase [Xanthomonadales bacterium]